MHHETLYDFLMMGGYAGYVWTAYGITAIVLIGNLVSALRRKKQHASAS